MVLEACADYFGDYFWGQGSAVGNSRVRIPITVHRQQCPSIIFEGILHEGFAFIAIEEKGHGLFRDFQSEYNAYASHNQVVHALQIPKHRRRRTIPNRQPSTVNRQLFSKEMQLKSPIAIALVACLLLANPAFCAQDDSAGEPQMPSPVASEQRISMARAIDISLRDNPQVSVSEHQVKAARANLAGQSAPVNPTVDYAGLNNTVGTTQFTNLNNYAGYVTLETSGRRGLRSRQARAQFQGTQADAETSRQSLRQSTADAYVNLQVANSALENEKTVYETAKRLSDLAQKQFQLGSVPETNAIRASVAVTQERENMLQAVNNVRIARANLNLQVGRAPNEAVDAADPLDFTPVDVDLKNLRDMALAHRSEVRSTEAAIRAGRAAVGLQRAQSYPNVIVGRGFSATPVEVGFAVPIDLGSIRNSIRQGEETVKAQQAQAEQTRQSVLLDTETAYLALTRARSAVEAYNSGILPSTRVAAEENRTRIRIGCEHHAGRHQCSADLSQYQK